MVKKKSYRTIREEAKIYYRNIGVLQCPVFPYEKIYFQNAGFKHLIYKEKKFRPISDQIRRFKSLIHIRETLLNATSFSEYREEKEKLTTAYFWAFEKRINNRIIHIIIRKIDKGPLHFFSIRSQ